MYIYTKKFMFIFLFSIFLFSFGFLHSEEHLKTKISPVLKSATTILGNEIYYPDGKAEIVSFIVEVPPGGVTPNHVHSYPVYIYIMEGEMTYTWEDGTVTIYKPGKAYIEDSKSAHYGKNLGDITLKALIVGIGAEGIKFTTSPKN